MGLDSRIILKWILNKQRNVSQTLVNKINVV
jgi:hypothetical protein